jgi:ligand-binding sensor domain-containing protein
LSYVKVNFYPVTCNSVLHLSLYLLILIFPSGALANTDSENHYRNYLTEQGLSNNSVQAIFKDKDGFTWLGTQDGLNRFDGQNFFVYKHDPNDSCSLSAGAITAIKQDRRGMIWISINGGGVNILNPYTGKISKILQKKHLIFHRSSYVKDLFIDRHDQVWMATWGGLYCYNQTTKKMVLYEKTDDIHSISCNDVKKIITDSKGLLWIATSDGLNSYDYNRNVFTRFFHQNTKNSISNNNVLSICMGPDGKLFIGTFEGGLNLYDTRKELFYQLPVKLINETGNIINTIGLSSTNSIYLGTENGLFEGQLTYIKPLCDLKLRNLYFKADEITSFIEDPAGIVLVGTNTNGFFILNSKINPFHNLKISKNTNIGNQVYSIAGNINGDIWFGSIGNGIMCYNKKSKAIETVLKNDTLSKTKIASICLDSRNTLWIGTLGTGLYVYDLKQRKLKRLKKNASITSIMEDTDGIMWVGTYTNLECFDKHLNSTRLFENKNGSLTSLTNNHVYFTYEDKQGNIWIGCFGGGVSCYEKKSHCLKHYFPRLDGPHSISHYNVTSCVEDLYGSLWFGTKGGGIYMFKKSCGHFKKYTVNEGLPSNTIQGILKDRKGRLWISTNKGICLAEMKYKKTSFRSFDKNDGLESEEFNERSVFKSVDGWLFFGGSKGIDYFNPDSIQYKATMLPVILSDLRIQNRKLNTDTLINFKKQISLSHSENFLTIDFATLGVTLQKNYKYKYKLDGVDVKWLDAGDVKSVTYANIAPGKYSFRVKATDIPDFWKTPEAVLSILILPPFWQSSWFNCLLVLFIASLLAGVIKLRENKLIRANEITQFKLLALRTQMNPHFIFNSLNSIQHFIGKNQSESAISYLSKFSKMVRKILDSSINTSNTLEEEILFLKQYIDIESLRFDDGIECIINIPSDLDKNNIEIPTMLLQPYVENAIIHGFMNKKEKGTLLINFTREKDVLKCVIEDNGVGRKHSMQTNNSNISNHKSQGISITKNRLQILNENEAYPVSVTISDLEATDGSARGTRVELYIPI